MKTFRLLALWPFSFSQSWNPLTPPRSRPRTRCCREPTPALQRSQNRLSWKAERCEPVAEGGVVEQPAPGNCLKFTEQAEKIHSQLRRSFNQISDNHVRFTSAFDFEFHETLAFKGRLEFPMWLMI